MEFGSAYSDISAHGIWIPTVSDALKVQIIISITHLTFCFFLVGKIMIRGKIIEKKKSFICFAFCGNKSLLTEETPSIQESLKNVG